MDLAGLVVATVALILSAWAALSTHRQARAAERATGAAEQSAYAAAETLKTAQKMEQHEAARLHAERRPEITVEHRELLKKFSDNGLVRGIRLVNRGSTPYDEWRISVDLDDSTTARLVSGLLDENDKVRPQLTITDIDGGQAISLRVRRPSRNSTGEAKLVVIARKGDEEWRNVLRLRFQWPGLNS